MRDQPAVVGHVLRFERRAVDVRVRRHFRTGPMPVLDMAIEERQVGALAVPIRWIIIKTTQTHNNIPSSIVCSLSSIKAKISEGPGVVTREARVTWTQPGFGQIQEPPKLK